MNSNRDKLLEEVSELMKIQADAYTRLELVTKGLTAALIQSDMHGIEKQTRSGEEELTRMRSRLLEMMKALTRFAEEKAATGQKLDKDTKTRFEESAAGLIETAKEFKRLADRTASLAMGGSSFSTACIQVCGIPPTTYNKPVLKRSGAAV